MFINQIQIAHKYNKLAELQNIPPNLHANNYIKIFPFKVISGAFLTTNTGFKGLASYVNDYNDLALIFTGNESVTTEWRESIELSSVKDEQNPADPDTNYALRTKKVGIFFEGILKEHYQAQQVSVYSPNNDFQKLVICRSFSVVFQIDRSAINSPEINNEIIKEFVKYEFDFFACPEINRQNEETKIKSKVWPNPDTILTTFTQWNHQLYRPFNTSFYYDGNNNIVAVEVKFVSINDFMSNTGLAIQQYINFGCPGQGYTFPLVDPKTKLVSLDPNSINNVGVTHAQLDLYGVNAISSIVFFGYKIPNIDEKDAHGNFIEKIYAPSEIYFEDGKFQAPIYDNTKQKALPEQNLYLVKEANEDIVTQYADWQKLVASYEYNTFYKKSYEGWWKIGTLDPKISNPIVTGRYKYNVIDQDFLKTDVETTITSKDYTKYSGLFTDNVYYKSQTAGLVDFSDYSSVKYEGIANFFLRNHILYSNIHQLPINIESSIAISNNLNLGVGNIIGKFIPFGGFFSAFFNQSLPLGFRLSNYTKKSAFAGFDYLMSAPIFDLQISIMGASTKGYVPNDAFRYGTSDAILSLGGQNSTTISFLGRLTNIVDMQPYQANTKTGNNMVSVETFMIGQKDPSPLSNHDTYFYTPNSKVKPNIQQDQKFVITGFKMQGKGKTDFRLTFYHGTYSPPAYDEPEITTNDSIWMGYYKTMSNVSENLFLWETMLTLGNPFFDFEETFAFPVSYFPKNEGTTINIDKVVVPQNQLNVINDWYNNYLSYAGNRESDSNWTIPNNNVVSGEVEINLEQTDINPHYVLSNLKNIIFSKDAILKKILLNFRITEIDPPAVGDIAIQPFINTNTIFGNDTIIDLAGTPPLEGNIFTGVYALNSRKYTDNNWEVVDWLSIIPANSWEIRPLLGNQILFNFALKYRVDLTEKKLYFHYEISLNIQDVDGKIFFNQQQQQLSIYDNLIAKVGVDLRDIITNGRILFVYKYGS